MSKFHFRLATLLRLRQATRDERRVQLGEAQRADAELQNRLARLGEQRQELQSQCRAAAGPGAVDLPRLIEAHQCAVALRTQEAEVQRQRQELAVEIDRRRQALLESDRDVRTLEKLRENQSQVHRQGESRQEAKRLDEAALQAVER
jgi:flagellar export protein FliJ